jgi:hypothetical protein
VEAIEQRCMGKIEKEEEENEEETQERTAPKPTTEKLRV